MIFSLFRKDARGGDRKRGGVPDTPTTRPVPSASRATDPREIARLTAAKIDEIESEMIAAARAPGAPPPVTRPIAAQAGLAGTVYVPSGIARAQAQAQAAALAAPPAGPPTAPAAAPELAPLEFESAAPAPALRAAPHPGGEPDTSAILGEAGGDLSVEVVGSSLPAAFEEAAVLYSNGQDEAAATVLQHAIRADQLGGHARQGWAMLFDLYQASGRKDDFESLAIDYSARFETSPPTWDDGVAPQVEDERAAAAAAGAPAVVALPAALDAQALKQLEQVQRFAQRNRGVVLDASPVRSVDPIGADLLLRVLNAFVRARRELALVGAEALFDLVRPTIEAGRRDPSESGWLLSLELLRLLGRQQEFEDLSIDYCVTYEVSPPSWEPMPPMVRTQHRAAAQAADVDRADDGGPAFEAVEDAFVLRGDLAGRASDTLAALRRFASERTETVIDCRRLRRVDFVAAGELLNEVVALRTGGKYLVFRDLNHPVAALLSVMGIPDLAEIRLRRH